MGYGPGKWAIVWLSKNNLGKRVGKKYKNARPQTIYPVANKLIQDFKY
jgi:hypothetical protein